MDSEDRTHEEKLKDYKSILRAAYAIHYRMRAKDDWLDSHDPHCIDFQEFMESKIQDLEFYIELEKVLRGEDEE